jgi:hypothetical protein
MPVAVTPDQPYNAHMTRPPYVPPAQPAPAPYLPPPAPPYNGPGLGGAVPTGMPTLNFGSSMMRPAAPQASYVGAATHSPGPVPVPVLVRPQQQASDAVFVTPETSGNSWDFSSMKSNRQSSWRLEDCNFDLSYLD